MREVNQNPGGNLRRSEVVFLCSVISVFVIVIAGISLVVFSHYRELLPNGNDDSTLYQTERWRARLPSPTVGHHVATLHTRERIIGLHTFHGNHTKCLAKSCKNMHIKLSVCSQGGDISLFPITSFSLHSESSAGVLHCPSRNSIWGGCDVPQSNALVSGTQMRGLGHIPPT